MDALLTKARAITSKGMYKSLATSGSNGAIDSPIDEAEAVQHFKQLIVECGPSRFPLTKDEGSEIDTELRCFLRARDQDLSKAADAYSAFLKWKLGAKPQSVTDADIGRALREEKAYYYRTDKSGHPVLYIRYSRHIPTEANAKETTLYVMYLMEKAIKLMAPVVSQLTVVCDVGDVSLKNFDLKQARELVPLLLDNYPERLSHLFFINAAWVFRTSWPLLSQLLPDRTAAKISIHGRDYYMALSECISPQDLPASCISCAKDVMPQVMQFENATEDPLEPTSTIINSGSLISESNITPPRPQQQRTTVPAPPTPADPPAVARPDSASATARQQHQQHGRLAPPARPFPNFDKENSAPASTVSSASKKASSNVLDSISDKFKAMISKDTLNSTGSMKNKKGSLLSSGRRMSDGLDTVDLDSSPVKGG